MGGVRLPAVAGRFYPDDPRACAEAVDGYLAQAGPWDGPGPRALVAPHAGFVYSGPVAATAYARLDRATTPTRVLVLGPNHTVPLQAMAVTSADTWRMPLGDVVIDPELRDACLECDGVIVDDEPHLREHALEVHVPFLQRVLGEFTLLPIVVGAVDSRLVADLLDAVWADDVLVVVSTDLSHYHDYSTATGVDRVTADAISAARFDTIDPEGACGARPLNGFLRLVAERGMRIEELDVRNSGDTAGGRDRVVGYGSFAVA